MTIKFLLCYKMSSKQEVVRERIVNFYNKFQDSGKKFTVDHFVLEGVPKRTIYNILKRPQVIRKSGSGKKAKIMTQKGLKTLERMFNNKDGVSQYYAAKKFDCTQQYISKTLKSIGIKSRKKQKSPAYTDDQISTVKSNCRWMTRNYPGTSFILDDESYFTLSKYQMPGNDIYYARDATTTPAAVKFRFKKKFEPKVMLYVAVSDKGVSEPYFKPSGLAINQEIYQKECLSKILLPFIRKYHSDDNYVFWPDKASSHYANKTLEFLSDNNIPFVPKDRNPTNLPQCRPVEDFFGQLSALVYQHGWKANSIKQLKTRIKKCLKEVDTTGVQRACSNIRTKLRAVADHGPFDQNH